MYTHKCITSAGQNNCGYIFLGLNCFTSIFMYYLIVTTANVLIRIFDVRMVLIWFDNAFCFYLDSFRCVFVYFVKFLFFVPVLKKRTKIWFNFRKFI